MAVLLTANEFQHHSERRVAEQLRAQLSSAGYLVTNYVLPSRAGADEIDLIVVLAEGVIAIEIKHWTGSVVSVGRMVEFEDGYRAPNPFPGLSYKAKKLRTELCKAALIDTRVPVGHALIHTGAIPWPEDVRTQHFLFALPVLTSDKPLLQPLSPWSSNARRLTPAECKAVATYLARPTRVTDTWAVSDYLLVEEAASSSHARQFFGRSGNLYDREVMLRCWELDPTADSSAHRHVRELTREASALAQLERYRCRAIPIVYDAFREPANFNVFWLVHEYVGRDTLRSKCSVFLSDPEFRVFVLKEIDAALDVLRRESLVHRNIDADAIYVSEAHDRVLLGGFEFSASEDGTTILRTVRESRDRPPEVVGGARASAASDIHAVARMVLDLLRSGEQPVNKRLKTIRNDPLRRALAQALDPDPTRRPVDLARLIAVLAGSVS